MDHSLGSHHTQATFLGIQISDSKMIQGSPSFDVEKMLHPCPRQQQGFRISNNPMICSVINLSIMSNIHADSTTRAVSAPSMSSSILHISCSDDNLIQTMIMKLLNSKMPRFASKIIAIPIMQTPVSPVPLFSFGDDWHIFKPHTIRCDLSWAPQIHPLHAFKGTLAIEVSLPWTILKAVHKAVKFELMPALLSCNLFYMCGY